MIVEMKNIYKSFGKNQVLKDVSITINGGEICALIGENGAGIHPHEYPGRGFARRFRHHLS